MLVRARSKGFRVVVFNSRGCGDSPVTTPQVLPEHLVNSPISFSCFKSNQVSYALSWINFNFLVLRKIWFCSYLGEKLSVALTASLYEKWMQFYSASFTGDIREVVAHVGNLYPNANLYAVGWSLGANILVRYLGQVGSQFLPLLRLFLHHHMLPHGFIFPYSLIIAW